MFSFYQKRCANCHEIQIEEKFGFCNSCVGNFKRDHNYVFPLMTRLKFLLKKIVDCPDICLMELANLIMEQLIYIRLCCKHFPAVEKFCTHHINMSFEKMSHDDLRSILLNIKHEHDKLHYHDVTYSDITLSNESENESSYGDCELSNGDCELSDGDCDFFIDA